MRRSRPIALLALAAAIAAIVLLPGGAAAVGDCVPQQSWGTLNAAYADQVLQLVNQHRAGKGLAPLGKLGSLTAAAEWKSLHMAGYGYMAHNDPAPPVARSVSDRLLACGYPATSSGWGENIAYGYASPAAVMSGWLNSSGHRANIENPSFRSIGVGVARNAAGTYYWTQEFGTLAGSTTQPPPPPPPPPAGDAQAPTAPTGLAVASATQTSISIRWGASSDNVGVAGYGIYVGTSRIGSVAGTSATITGFSCGRTYTLGVDAADAAGNRSARATVTASTSACATSPPPPPPPPAPTPPPPPPPAGDTQAPTAPGGLQVAASRTSLALRWTASTDDVGVVGYRVYRGSTHVGTTAGTSATLGGLRCGTWYRVSVRAVDDAGNVSPATGRYARTASCW